MTHNEELKPKKTRAALSKKISPSTTTENEDLTGTRPTSNFDDSFNSPPGQNQEISSTQVQANAESSRSQLIISLSKTLVKKLYEQAEEEGLSMEELTAELLSEAVVVRAWEIVEKRNQLRGGAQPPSPQINNRPNNNSSGNQFSRGQRKPQHRGGMSHTRYQSIMDDKATFLEYVRSQERNRR